MLLLDIVAVEAVVDAVGDDIDSLKSIHEISQYLTRDSVVETQMPVVSWVWEKLSLSWERQLN